MRFTFNQRNLVSTKFTLKRKAVLFVEIFFVTLLVIGTFFSLMNFENFSLSNTANKIKGVLSIQKETNIPSSDISQESKVKLFFKQAIDQEFGVKSYQDFTIISTKQKLRVYVNHEIDLENQAETLQNILTKAKIDNKEVSLVDFRFSKVVVRYSK